MSINILYAGNPKRWDVYQNEITKALNEIEIDANLSCDIPADQVDYIIYDPNSELQDFTPFTRTKAILGLWAGVERIVYNRTLTQPYTRMVDQGLSEGMTEWVVGHVLRHHLEMDQDIHRTKPAWGRLAPPLARDRRVGILGLGELGRVAAKALTNLNFPVSGWSRGAKAIDGVTCLHGDEGLEQVLRTSDILVLLLPATKATENVLDADHIAMLPEGAVIINPGRGPLIDDKALLEALDRGHIGHATLDVFRVEPLPDDDPYWAHPKVTVTPHIASDTRPDTAAKVIAENIRRGESREPFLHLVDKKAGY
ncbi:glyoxylate/hydroxypyruvate reductase A [Aliiroseovarius sp. F20344]|uniref:2-hydroxyacid dehydrogenase n=1 Tax=Aliiroseovarius sp. F20344 TaxID=2926414 RepID=UPI001FF57D9D|nr:glyoxylate/hydroxypyruvate reductase A [Aliiroseovarius sp. F20344]MCK0141910.1 glyoxylate/hydroxypyruvate reductase A [Aliiroseovarius sp. F20344]